MQNILLTSVGRRVELVDLFHKAVRDMNIGIAGVDIDGLAPALFGCNQKGRVPRIDNPDYLTRLLGIVERDNVCLVVPTIDTELEILAAHVDDFESQDCLVAVSSKSFVRDMLDKWITYWVFAKANILTPRTWTPQQARNPESDLPSELFIKPRRGSASTNCFKITRDQVDAALTLVPDAVIQEYVDGSEVTIDAYVDMITGRLVHFVPRYRLKTLGGECIQSFVFKDDDCNEQIKVCLDHLATRGARGPITLQGFRTIHAGMVFTEVNPRFGGGFPMSADCGAKYTEYLVNNMQGFECSPHIGEYSYDKYYSRALTGHEVSPLWQ